MGEISLDSKEDDCTKKKWPPAKYLPSNASVCTLGLFLEVHLMHAGLLANRLCSLTVK